MKKDGYGPAGPFMKAATDAQTVILSAGHPMRESRLQLARPAQITGQAVDEDTRKPVANLAIGIRQVWYANGHRRFFPGGGGTTDQDGRFVAKGLVPAEYVAIVRPKVSGKERLLKQFSKEDLEAVDQYFEQTYWPGGHGEDSAYPMPVGSGASESLGQLVLRKRPLYRVHFSFAAGTCASGDDVNVGEFIIQGLWSGEEDLGTVPCGKDFLVRSYAPGLYLLQVWGGRGAENRRRGTVSFEVKDRNLDLTVAMGRGVDVEGKIVTADGSRTPPFDDISIMMRPVGGIPFADGIVKPDAGGKFRAVNAQVTKEQLIIGGIGAGFCIKEIRYNGSRLPDSNFVTLNAGAMTQSLEIVIDDKPAVLAGAVTNSDHPVSQPLVLMVEISTQRPIISRIPNSAVDKYRA